MKDNIVRDWEEKADSEKEEADTELNIQYILKGANLSPLYNGLCAKLHRFSLPQTRMQYATKIKI